MHLCSKIWQALNFMTILSSPLSSCLLWFSSLYSYMPTWTVKVIYIDKISLEIKAPLLSFEVSYKMVSIKQSEYHIQIMYYGHCRLHFPLAKCVSFSLNVYRCELQLPLRFTLVPITMSTIITTLI